MGKRSTSPRSYAGRDPFGAAAQMWGTGEAERRRRRAAVEREAIQVVGSHRVRGGAEGGHVQPAAPDPVLELHRRGHLVPVPEYHVSGVVGLGDEDESPPPAPASSPSWVSEHDRGRTLEALVQRAEAARRAEESGDVPRHRRRASSAPRAHDAARAAQEQERQRRLREAYEAGRPAEIGQETRDGARAATLPQARQVIRARVPRARPTPGEPHDAPGPRVDLARIERDVGAIVSSVRRAREEAAPAGERPGSAPELRQDVLRELNRKYERNFQEPWQMLAYLRRGADQLRAAGAALGRIERVAADHGRLRRALEAP